MPGFAQIRLVVIMVAGWISREQASAIAFLGIGNEIVRGVAPQRVGRVEVSERLGGLLSYYHRKVAMAGLDRVFGHYGVASLLVAVAVRLGARSAARRSIPAASHNGQHPV